MIFKAILGAAPLLFAGVVVYERAVVPITTQFAEPTTWVAFSADSRRVLETGTVLVGHFYRSGDGSTRGELGPSLDNITGININNIALQLNYRWTSDAAWSQHPMQLPPNGWAPPHHRLSPAETWTSEKYEGFQVVKIQRGALLQTEAPELNWLTVAFETNDCGAPGKYCSLRLSNIKVGEPDPQLFLPPSDEAPIKSAVPGGIVRHDAPR